MVDEEAFTIFWEAIDDLFEDEEDDGGAEQAAVMDMSNGAVDEGYLAARNALEELLGSVDRAGIDTDPDVAQRIDNLCAALEECKPQVNIRSTIEMNDRRLAGDWELVYTCSEMFKFN